MPLKIQMAVLDLIIRVTGGMIESRMPDWLIRPGRIECGKRWLLVCHIYLGRNASLKAISGAAQWPVNISKTLRTRIADLEDNLRKQEAYIAQAKLLEFMASRRNRLSPIRFANATAGLPFIGWRHSESSCANVKAGHAFHNIYELFQVVKRALPDPPQTAKLAVRQVEAYLKKHKRPNAGSIQTLREEWYYLQTAIETAYSQKPPKDAMAYRVFAKCRRRSSSRSQWDQVLAKEERL